MDQNSDFITICIIFICVFIIILSTYNTNHLNY